MKPLVLNTTQPFFFSLAVGKLHGISREVCLHETRAAVNISVRGGIGSTRDFNAEAHEVRARVSSRSLFQFGSGSVIHLKQQFGYWSTKPEQVHTGS